MEDFDDFESAFDSEETSDVADFRHQFEVEHAYFD